MHADCSHMSYTLTRYIKVKELLTAGSVGKTTKGQINFNTFDLQKVKKKKKKQFVIKRIKQRVGPGADEFHPTAVEPKDFAKRTAHQVSCSPEVMGNYCSTIFVSSD